MSLSRLECGVHDWLHIYHLGGIFYFPWHRYRIQDSGILYLAHRPHKLIQMCIQINIKSDGDEPWAGRLPLRLIYQSLSWNPPTHCRYGAQWLERASDSRVVAGSNPAEAVWKLWQFSLPHFTSVFRKRH